MLSLEHVSKTYDTRHGRHHVLKDINLTLGRGRNIGILGRNGAGKSTLIRLIAGAERPTSGRVVRKMSVSWPLAFVGAFAYHLTGLDNLKFICRIYGTDYKKVTAIHRGLRRTWTVHAGARYALFAWHGFAPRIRVIDGRGIRLFPDR